MRRVISKRKQYKAFSRGTIRFLNTGNPRVLSFIREYENEKILVLMNLSRYSQIAHIELRDYAGYKPVEVFSQNEFPEIETSDYYFPLQFKDYFWFELKKPDEQKQLEEDGLKLNISLKTGEWNRLTASTMKRIGDILLNYISKSRWFRGKAKKIKGIDITDTIAVNDNDFYSHILMVDVSYFQSKTESYIFPVSVAVRDEASDMKYDYPHAILTNVEFENTTGVLYDGVYNPALQEKLFELIVSGSKMKGKYGTISGRPGKLMNRMVKKRELPLDSHVVKADQSNTSILYDNRLFFKIYRSPEEGKNPEIEILKFLTEKTRFANLPPFAGSLEYNREGADVISLATLAGFVPNQGNAWELTQSFIGEFFTRVRSTKNHRSAPPDYMPALLDDYREEDAKHLDELIDHFYIEMVELLGKRTAEMHLAIASAKEDPDFVPEPFSLLYQRSMYQTFRTLMKRTFSDLRSSRSRIPENSLELLESILDNENAILKKLKDILASEKISSIKSRIHGDYHLGQVLFTGKDFIIIDFEGEPVRSLSARKLKYCPFRDVAGMLRSFHYAIYMGLQNQELLYPGSTEFFEPWVEHWYKRVSYRFLASYLETAERASFVPRKREHIDILIRLFVIEKAIYETDYEMNNRPDWIRIPLNGLAKIVEDLLNIEDEDNSG
ncbi:MAG TPA: putative maltokinase [Bacteroidales bacterium]|nr:putative maltokinase [Bacteroidales bacterium]